MSTSYCNSPVLHMCSSCIDDNESSSEKKVYVKYIPLNVTVEDLIKHMEPAGKVLSARILSSKYNQYYTSAVVKYASEEGASAAVATLHSSKIMGKAIDVFSQAFNMMPYDEVRPSCMVLCLVECATSNHISLICSLEIALHNTSIATLMHLYLGWTFPRTKETSRHTSPPAAES